MRAAYIAVMEKGPEGYGVWFPDLPGCVSAGETEVEARAGAVEALALHLEGLVEDGQTVPRPTDYNTIGPEDVGDGFLYLFVVDAETEHKGPPMMERVNVMMAKPLLDRVGRAAAATHSGNRSAWLSDAARDFLAKQMSRHGSTNPEDWKATGS